MFPILAVVLTLATLAVSEPAPPSLTVGHAYIDKTDADFQRDCTAWHNHFRSLHLSGPLTSDDRALHAAKIQAAYTSRHGINSPNRVDFGVNKFLGMGPAPADCREAVKLWYNGNKQYDWKRPGFNWDSGAFSQVVWRTSAGIGCARYIRETADGKSGQSWETVIVCAYSPSGNVLGSFKDNVYPRQAKL